jgi:hypothetical protein
MSDYQIIKKELEEEYCKYLEVDQLNGYQWWQLAGQSGMSTVIISYRERDCRVRIRMMEKYLEYLKSKNKKRMENTIELTIKNFVFTLTEINAAYFACQQKLPLFQEMKTSMKGIGLTYYEAPLINGKHYHVKFKEIKENLPDKTIDLNWMSLENAQWRSKGYLAIYDLFQSGNIGLSHLQVAVEKGEITLAEMSDIILKN